MLHELSHAWHDLKLGLDYQPIADAYKKAKASGKYGGIYARKNKEEYFAELTEAFFWRNE